MSSIKRILLLEDDPLYVKIVKRVFRPIANQGYVMEHVGTLEDAIKRLKEGGIDLLLSDLTLPDSFGVDTFVTLNVKFKTLPIVVLTGMDDPELAEKLIGIGAQDYIVKSDLNEDALESALRNALARSSLSPRPTTSSPRPAPATKTDTKPISLDIVDQNIASYKLGMRLFHEQPLSQAMPDIFNEFCESYKPLLPLSTSANRDSISNKVKTHWGPNSEAFIMAKLSPFDVKEIHEHTIKQLGFVDTDSAEFKKLSTTSLFEAVNLLYETYSKV